MHAQVKWAHPVQRQHHCMQLPVHMTMDLVVRCTLVPESAVGLPLLSPHALSLYLPACISGYYFSISIIEACTVSF